ncbi:pentapeptide repeat-containing protein [Streptomyces longwoodensis]|uniref:pentapeptide repeat-containing protein n=1 Tax=Streptomyces longwoodensis TaxID=68231 RepID=UPI0030DFB71B|nr:pentapeptide repeat-containing protein [Streptomyces longwoodensis]
MINQVSDQTPWRRLRLAALVLGVASGASLLVTPAWGAAGLLLAVAVAGTAHVQLSDDLRWRFLSIFRWRPGRHRYLYGHRRALYRQTENRRQKVIRRIKQHYKTAFASIAFLILAVAALLLVLRGPWWFDGEYIDRDGLRSGSAALVTGLRTALVQIIAAIGASVALLYTARNYRLTRRGQVTDRFTKALERLGSDEMYVRIGGVIALEQILQDAPEQALHTTQVLSAFVRRRAPRAEPINVTLAEKIVRARKAAKGRSTSSEAPQPLPTVPDEDVQAALTVLTQPDLRRHLVDKPAPDFSNLHLAGASFAEADLSFFNLSGANLSGANLWKARLIETKLENADLSNSDISRGNFTYALMNGVNLRNAFCARTNFTRTLMHRADFTKGYVYATLFAKTLLEDAVFESADIDEADFTDANLRRAKFTGAKVSDSGSIFDHAILEDADLSETEGIDVEHVVASILSNGTLLPEDMYSLPEIQERIRNSPAPRWDA